MSDLGWLSEPVPLVFLCAVFGLLVGSFLNVVILRLPARLHHDWRNQARDVLELTADTDVIETAPPDLVFTGSHCPSCKHKLSVLDNIPLLSWLALRGRCRYCKASISAQYPLVEALTLIASAVLAWKFGFTGQLLFGLLLTWTLIAAAGIDARTQLLPDQLTVPLMWLGLLISLFPIFVDSTTAIIGAAIGYLSLWSVFWMFKLITGKEGMGYGDFKLLAALGAWMGAMSLLPIILMSSLFGAIIGSILLKMQSQDRSTPIPFGPFIAIAGWVWFVFGEGLATWYRGFFPAI
ncbi:MAG: A24 family peptidase [Dokdonella sp.]